MATIGEAVEVREDIPLKSGKKGSIWCSCDEDCIGGSKFINFAFATLTFVITIALLLQIYYGDYQVVPHGSVATDSFDCSKIGTSILKKGGNSVDAAIASAFCLAVVTPHLTSLDGEGTMMVYNHRMRQIAEVIDFTTVEPTSNSMPRLVLGLAYAHQQHGSMKWKDLVQPAANLAKNGFLITKALVQAVINAKAEDLYGHLESGQLLIQEELGETLEDISNLSDDELYGHLPEPIHTKAQKAQFNNYDIFVPSTSSSIGPYLLKNLEQIEKYNFTEDDLFKPDYVYNLAKAMEIFYNDYEIFEKFHIGTTTNIAVMDLKDNYVSLVTGLYSPFGSGEMSPLGYILDVKQRDKPCSRIPFIITDNSVICGRRMVFGGNDVAITIQLITTLLITKENITESIEAPRFHLLNNGTTIGIEVEHKQQFTAETLQSLEKLIENKLIHLNPPYPSVNIVEKVNDDLSSHSDSRGGGIASRF